MYNYKYYFYYLKKYNDWGNECLSMHTNNYSSCIGIKRNYHIDNLNVVGEYEKFRSGACIKSFVYFDGNYHLINLSTNAFGYHPGIEIKIEVKSSGRNFAVRTVRTYVDKLTPISQL